MLVSHGRECVGRDPSQEWRGVESDGAYRTIGGREQRREVDGCNWPYFRSSPLLAKYSLLHAIF